MTGMRERTSHRSRESGTDFRSKTRPPIPSPDSWLKEDEVPVVAMVRTAGAAAADSRAGTVVVVLMQRLLLPSLTLVTVSSL